MIHNKMVVAITFTMFAASQVREATKFELRSQSSEAIQTRLPNSNSKLHMKDLLSCHLARKETS